MRRLFIKILQLLDGTPAVYGKRESGQSVVELALITPILIILLAGLVEIGWFANNYLTLLDVSRAGARRGAVLQDQKSPLSWDDKYSLVPNVLLPTAYQTTNGLVTLPDTPPVVQDQGQDSDRWLYRWYPGQRPGGYPVTDDGGVACSPAYVARLFYNEVICTMITSMDPLVLDPTDEIDDMIVSGFSLQMVDPSLTTNPDLWLAPSPMRPIPANVPQVVVAGRYPANANECDVLDAGGAPSLGARELRDPFDFNNNSHRDVQPPSGIVTVDGTDDYTELVGYDARYTDTTHPENAEKTVGFSLFGNHKIPGTFCVGSEWTMRQVEDMMNLPNYDVDTTVRKGYLPSQGLILVEIFWEHTMLLKIPLLSPVFAAVGNQDGKMVIDVWAAFPLPSVEPHILFPCPNASLAGCS